MGIGFIVAAIAVMLRIPDGVAWGWALFFPGFACLGRGIAAIVAAQKKSEQLGIAGRANAIAAQPNPAPMIMGRKTGEMVPPPPSVTEGTTRHLGADVVTKQRDS